MDRSHDRVPNSEASMSDGGKGSRPRPKSVDADTFASNWDSIFGKKEKLNSIMDLHLGGNYDCHRCYHENDALVNKMILCPQCGNKRCPKASDHRLDCTASNEPGQPGSVY